MKTRTEEGGRKWEEGMEEEGRAEREMEERCRNSLLLNIQKQNNSYELESNPGKVNGTEQ